jgi:hypothetical protein
MKRRRWRVGFKKAWARADAYAYLHLAWTNSGFCRLETSVKARVVLEPIRDTAIIFKRSASEGFDQVMVLNRHHVVPGALIRVCTRSVFLSYRF